MKNVVKRLRHTIRHRTKNRTMRILELFSGTKSFSKEAEKRGHKCFTIDIDKKSKPDLCIDILDFDISMLPEEFKHPDIIWASPPCQCFSIASVYRHWKNGIPKDEKTLKAIEIVKKTINIIKEINPEFYIIENPRGMLRKQEFMQNLNRNTITYCKYGLEYQKATDLWNNLENWKPREVCKANAPCHVRAPRGSNAGVQGTNGYRANRQQKHPIDSSMLRLIKPEDRMHRNGNHPDWSYKVDRSAKLRAIVPRELCLEIIEYCENSTTKSAPGSDSHSHPGSIAGKTE